MSRKPARQVENGPNPDAERLRNVAGGLAAALESLSPCETRIHEFKPATGQGKAIRVTLYTTFDVPVPDDER
jgi:hypothetical protein